MCLDDGNSDPNYMKKYEDRLKTFKNWEYGNIVKPEYLAKNGFYNYGPSDYVRCIFCKVIIGDWETDDKVEVEHQKYSSECLMVKAAKYVRKYETCDYIKCKLCKKNDIKLLLYPCLHFCICEDCRNIDYCPFCGIKVNKIFKATINKIYKIKYI